jgi:FlaA1/EpsC-like NDP-sugar epimerase
VAKTQSLADFPLEVFVVDVLLCTTLVAGSRLALRVAPDAAGRACGRDAEASPPRRSGSLRQTARARVAGDRRHSASSAFLDDNADVRRRRVLGVKVLGSLDEAEALIAVARPDEVLVTIPDVPTERLNAVVSACAAADVPCRLVRSRTEISQPALVEISAE